MRKILPLLVIWIVVLSGLGAGALPVKLLENKDNVLISEPIFKEKKDFQLNSFKKGLYGVSFVDDNNGTIVGEDGAIFHTVDGGESWNRQTLVFRQSLWVPRVRLCDVSFFNEDVGMAVGFDGTVVYTKSGERWRTARTGNMDSFFGAHMVTSMLGFAVGVNPIFQPLVVRTKDCWQTWDVINFYLDHNGSNHEGGLTDICSTNTSTCFASALVWNGDGAVVKSVDCGETWETSYWTNYRFRAIDFPSSHVGYVVGDYGIICKTSDGGDTWELVYSNYGITILNDVSFPTMDIGTAVGSLGCILRTEDGGDNWKLQDSGVDSTLNAVYFANPDIGYVVGNDGIVLKTTDGGDSWMSLNINLKDSAQQTATRSNRIIHFRYASKIFTFVNKITTYKNSADD